MDVMGTSGDSLKMSNFSRRHFRDIDIKELIYHYKQYDCLWNFNCLAYKNKTLKQGAWQDIADYFHKDVNEVKRKIKYLRTAYVAEKKKVIASRKLGKPYKPSLFYFNELDFLDNVVVWRKEPNEREANDLEFESVEIAPDETDEFTNYNTTEEVDFKSPNLTCKVEAYDERSFSPTVPLDKSNSPKSYALTTVVPQTKKRKYHEAVKLEPNTASSTTSPLKDCSNRLNELYNSFGKTISLQLQLLPLETAVVTMSEIHNILTNKTLEYIKSTQNDNDNSQSDSENSFSELVETLDDNY